MYKTLAICLFTLLSVCQLTQAAEWLTDYNTAMARATETGRPVLVDFTGSDWCGWCKILDKEVFKTPVFDKWASDHVVLLKLDFPRAIAQSEELKRQNEALRQKFDVQGFPTIIILGADGQQIGRTGYQRGGAASYIKHLEGIMAKK